MIIPVKCFTCGKVVGSTYKKYRELMDANCLRLHDGKLYKCEEDSNNDIKKDIYTKKNRKEHIISFMSSLQKKIISENKEDIKLDKPIEAMIMNQLGIKRYCCKRILLGTIDLLDKL